LLLPSMKLTLQIRLSRRKTRRKRRKRRNRIKVRLSQAKRIKMNLFLKIIISRCKSRKATSSSKLKSKASTIMISPTTSLVLRLKKRSFINKCPFLMIIRNLIMARLNRLKVAYNTHPLPLTIKMVKTQTSVMINPKLVANR